MTQYTDIIVGSGSSGAVIAARLTEDPSRRVLLIEAGPDYPDPEDLPRDLRNGLYPSLVEHDWGYQAEAVPGREIPLARGRVVGGTSAVNSCLAVRPDPEDFAEWVGLGNEGWSWSEVLPYFVRLEDDKDFGAPLHGKGGPIPVWRWQDEQLIPLQKALLDACVGLGFPKVEDHNAPGATGVGPLAQNLDGTRRISTAIAYLEPVRKNPNLEIRPDTLVDRVLIEGGRAVGVRVLTDGVAEEIRGDRVVLSAGAIGTPPILLRSGVGPAEKLRALGVAPVADLPGVGANLLDHPTCLITLRPRPGVYDESLPGTQIVLQYTAPGSAEENDMQIYLFSHVDLNDYAKDVKDQIGTAYVFMISAGVERPHSVGEVSLTSADPAEAPVIRFNFLSDPEDRRRLREGMRLAWRIAQTPQLRVLSLGRSVPSADVIEDDDALDAFMLATVGTHFHPVGTARMGAAGDPGAVVDAHLRVHGVPGLRVADASVMPTIVRANTNLTCIMIGERAAEWLAAESD